MQRYPCKALVAIHSDGPGNLSATSTTAPALDLDRGRSGSARFTYGDDPKLAIVSPSSLQIARSSTDVVELEFDCVLDTQDLAPVTLYDHTLRPLVSASFVGTNAALLHFVGRRSGGLLSSLLSDGDSLLSQVCFDLFDTISVRGDTVECSVSLSILEVRRDAIMDLVHPENDVDLKLQTDWSGRKLWRLTKTSDIVVTTPEEMVELLISADTRRAVFNSAPEDTQSMQSTSQILANSSVPLISITVRRQHSNESIRTGRLILADIPIDIDTVTLNSLLETFDSLSGRSNATSLDPPLPPDADAPAALRVLHECLVGNCRTSVLVSAFRENASQQHMETLIRILKSASRCRKIETRVQTNLLRSNAELNQIIELLSAENRWRTEAINQMTDLMKSARVPFDLDQIEADAKRKISHDAGSKRDSGSEAIVALNRSASKLKMSAESQLATLATELQSTRSSLEQQNLEAQRRIKTLESSLSIALESNEQLKFQLSERGLELIRAESMLSQSMLQIKKLEHLLDRQKADSQLALLAASRPTPIVSPPVGSPQRSTSPTPAGGHRRPPRSDDAGVSHSSSSTALPEKEPFSGLSLDDLKAMLKHEKSESDVLRQKVVQAEHRVDDLDADVSQLHTMVAKMKELLRRQDEKLQNEREVMNEELRRAQLLLTGKLSASASTLGRSPSFSASLKRPESPPAPLDPSSRVASITIEPSVVPPLSSPLPRRPSFMDQQTRSTSPDPRRETTSSSQTLSPPSLDVSNQSVRAVSGRNFTELRKYLGSSAPAIVPPASAEEKGGWLSKEGGLVRSWKKRWFVVRLDKLLYFTDHLCKELKGEILLTPRSYVTDAFEHTKKENSFAIYDLNNSGRTYFLQAGSRQEADDWMAFLTRKIASLNPT